MKKTLSLLIISFVLISCTSKEELFAKKQECVGHSQKMTEMAKNFSQLNEDGRILEIFYSEKWNSCYFVFTNQYWRYLFDYFSQKLVTHNLPTLSEDCMKDEDCKKRNSYSYEQFEQALKDLKGE